ncbi:MAG: DNA polymerase III subunit delta [Solirubrobacteraceae bacterium]
MPPLKPAYLIHGDDHGAIAERRAGLHALALEEGDASSVEVLSGEAGAPAGVALALAAMTFAIGRRVIVVDGVERWKQAEVQEHLLPAMRDLPPDTTVALFAREEGRTKAPPAVHEAVKAAKGQIVEQGTVKPWELPRWAREQAARLGIELDQAAAKALVAQVGERQQRILRELEKLALELDDPREAAVGSTGVARGGAGATDSAGDAPRGGGGAPKPIRVSAEQIEQHAAHSAERRVFALADALVGGDSREATLVYLRLRRQGERLGGLAYLMASRLREALAVALRLQAGESAAEIKRSLRMPSRAAERFLADVARSDPERLRAALGTLADLELDTRGGAQLRAGRSRLSHLHEDTLALRAIEQITA